MRKKLLAVFAAATLFAGILSFSACNGGQDSASAPETTSGTSEATTDYTNYSDGYITFAYPKSWTQTNISGMTMFTDATGGNAIGIIYLPKTDIYAAMTEESFAALLKPTIEAGGVTVSDVTLWQTTKNEQKITVISYTATAWTVSMSQTMMFINSGDRTYQLTVTQTKFAGLSDNVYDSLSANKTEDILPSGCTTYSDGYISFAYPQNWTKTEASGMAMLVDPVTGNNINVLYLPKTAIYETLTKESFETVVKPALEAEGLAVSDVVVFQKTKEEQILTEVSYTATIQTISVSQTLLFINSGDRTYQVTLSQKIYAAGLLNDIESTIKALK